MIEGYLKKKDVEFPKPDCCYLTGPDHCNEFRRLPIPFLLANYEYAPNEKVRYWAAKILRSFGTRVPIPKFELRFHKIGREFQYHKVARDQLLIKGAQRALAQRLVENKEELGDVWSYTPRQIRGAHILLDDLGVSRTNCCNHFKQFWPQQHEDLFNV